MELGTAKRETAILNIYVRYIGNEVVYWIHIYVCVGFCI
jgi:hypothetical protein